MKDAHLSRLMRFVPQRILRPFQHNLPKSVGNTHTAHYAKTLIRPIIAPYRVS